MSKIVLVETVSTFRHVYAVELKDDDPNEYALDTIVCETTKDNSLLNEVGQHHVAEDIFSYRQVSEEEYLKLFDEMNDYLKEWTPEQKKNYIYKEEA